MDRVPQGSGRSLQQCIERLIESRHIEWIGHFHTAGNPGRRDMDETQELNYGGICQAISETDYDLYVGHEFKPKGEPIEALRRAYAACAQG